MNDEQQNIPNVKQLKEGEKATTTDAEYFSDELASIMKDLKFPEIDIETDLIDQLGLPEIDFASIEIPEVDLASLDKLIQDVQLPEIDSTLIEEMIHSSNIEGVNFDGDGDKAEVIPDPNLTATDAAKWMVQQMQEYDILHQHTVAYHLEKYFGEKFVYRNRHGNRAIAREVLKAFLILTQKTVVWNRKKRYWRKRREGDPCNSRMVDY